MNAFEKPLDEIYRKLKLYFYREMALHTNREDNGLSITESFCMESIYALDHILFGMIVALFVNSPALREGTRFASKRLLQLSVVLLGFEMNMRNVLAVGSESLVVMAFTLTAAFLSARIMQRVLRLDSVTATLIGVGTAICGGSAIAATAPVIGAKEEDIAHSISTIFLFNIAAVFIFPALGHLMNMGGRQIGRASCRERV